MDFSLQKNFFWLLVGRFNYLLFFSVFWSAALELWVSILERVRPRSSVPSERTFYSHLYMFHGRWTFGSVSLVIRTNENRKDIKTEVSWKDDFGLFDGNSAVLCRQRTADNLPGRVHPPRSFLCAAGGAHSNMLAEGHQPSLIWCFSAAETFCR